MSAKSPDLRHLFLIDGSGFIFRAYHALPPMTRADGTPVGAVYGFTTMVMRLIEDTDADHLAVVFDTARKTFRNDIYPAYKANRPPPPDDLIPQFELVREATRALGVASVELAGFEADDLIATYAAQAEARGARVTIVSSDKDLMQLVGDRVSMLDAMKNRRIGPAEVIEKFGVGPDRVIDVQALAGDSSDNVPGVSGIGDKTAPKLIAEFGSLDELINMVDDKDAISELVDKKQKELRKEIFEEAGEEFKINSPDDCGRIIHLKLGMPGRKKKKNKKTGEDVVVTDTETLENLASSGHAIARNILDWRFFGKIETSLVALISKGADIARVSRELVRLRDDAPVSEPLESFAKRQPDTETLLTFLLAQNFKSLITKIESRLGAQDFKSLTAKIESRLGAARDGPAPQPATPQPAAPQPAAPQPAAPGAIPGAEPAAPVYEAVQDTAHLADWIARATAAGLVAVDTETTSLDAMQADLVGVSLAVEAGRACYIPLGHKGADAQPSLDLGGVESGASRPGAPRQIPLEEALGRLKPLFEDPSVLKVGQNIKYDMKVLAGYGIELAPVDDTMVISYVLDGGLHGHGMDELAALHLAHQTIKFKDVAGSGKKQVTFDLVPLEKAMDYAAEDADITLRLHRTLKPRLLGEHMLSLYEALERPLIPVLSEMERAGIRVDAAQLRELSEDFTTRLAKLEEKILGLAGHRFNIGSPKQLGEVLFDEMGLAGGKKGKTGAYATGADVLDDLAGGGVEIAERVLAWRQLAKLKSTYTDALVRQINPRTGRVHTSFAQAVASTGRLSSKDPNLQNIPVRTEEGRKIRRAFVPAKGCVLLSADYSQIELRLLAHVAGIEALKSAFRDGLDIHAMTASQVFGVPVEGMDPLVRRQAKAINFGIIYGISAFGLARQLGIARGAAQAYIDAYFERYPGIRDYMERTKAQAREQGFVTTLYGRKCFVPGIADKNAARRNFAERAAINAPIQGGAADIIKRAMTRLPKALAKAGLAAKMLLQVHDELIFDVPESESEETAALTKQVMEQVARLDVPLIVDTGVGANWDQAH